MYQTEKEREKSGGGGELCVGTVRASVTCACVRIRPKIKKTTRRLSCRLQLDATVCNLTLCLPHSLHTLIGRKKPRLSHSFVVVVVVQPNSANQEFLQVHSHSVRTFTLGEKKRVMKKNRRARPAVTSACKQPISKHIYLCIYTWNHHHRHLSIAKVKGSWWVLCY